MDQNQQPVSSEPPVLPPQDVEIESPTQATQPVQPLAPKRRRKGLWVGIIIGIIVVLLGAGTAAGYFFWYQNPDKVVHDGLINAIKSKTRAYNGQILIQMGEGNSARLEFSGKDKAYAGELSAKLTGSFLGQDIEVEGDALMADNGDLYVKFQHTDRLLDYMKPVGDEGTKLRELTEQLVAKIEDQWIRISVEDLKEFSPSYAETQQCFKEAFKRIESDATIMSEAADVYGQHRFVNVAESLGERDGSLGYRLELDEAKLKDFTMAFEDTELYGQLRACDEDAASFETDKINDDNSRFELWVNKWTHEITKVRNESKDASSSYLLEMSTQFNQPVDVAAPEAALSLSELKADFEAIAEESQRQAQQEFEMQQQADGMMEQVPQQAT
jgi:hypothetical protein